MKSQFVNANELDFLLSLTHSLTEMRLGKTVRCTGEHVTHKPVVVSMGQAP